MKKEKKELQWEISFGTYKGVLIGYRNYNEEDLINHVFYLPFVDVCLTIVR
jgi:hypothetical protein